MWICKHCNEEFNFNETHEKANHSRWCDKNPKRNDTQNIKLGALKKIDSKYGKLTIFKVNCHNCSNIFNVEERKYKFPSKKKYFCSRSCANTRHHSEETKRKISISFKNFTNISFCKKCNRCFKAKKNKKFCSNECSYKSKITYNRSDLINYRKRCSFKFNLKDYHNEFNFELIEKYGWYKAKNHGDNQNGVSRDHIVSVKFGFENNIPSWIISHPANCELMRHKENVSKNKKCNLSLDELLIKIEKWNKKYSK